MAQHAAASQRHYDTIVIGAGMSGLAAAARLYQHEHFQDKNQLLVLEGRDRIGGRIGAVAVNGSRLDTGANWIHGIGTKDNPNPLIEILPHKRYRPLNGTVLARAPAVDSDDGWVHVTPTDSSNTKPETEDDAIIPSDIAGVMLGSVWGLVGALHEQAAETPASQAKNITMLQALVGSDEFQQAWDAIPDGYHHTFSSMPQFLEGMEAAPLAAPSAEHPESSPGMSLLEFGIDDFDGDQVFLQDGYIAVIEEVAKDLVSKDLIQTSAEVLQIHWDQSPIVIDTAHGTYTAREVVCTLPLGVLKHDANLAQPKLFDPILPDVKREAIASLGYGTLDKIFLVYKSAWWLEEPYTPVWKKGLVHRSFGTDSDEEGQSDAHDGPLPDDSFDMFLTSTNRLPGIEISREGAITSPGVSNLMFLNHAKLTGFPVLSVFVSCSRAAKIETMKDSEAEEILHEALVRSVGQEVPKPEAVHVTRWKQDEFSRGSYSHMIAGLTQVSQREEFQVPLKSNGGSKLRFAGEHTSRNHFATVHGALISGRREADDILNILHRP